MADARIQGLQVGRALASIAVVLLHASVAATSFSGHASALSSLFDRGYLGVDFFFALSGFIIYHAHSQDREEASAAGAYLRKRLIRIFVPYLPVGLAVVAAYAAFPSFSAHREWSVLSSLLLVPSWSGPALPVAWTLVHELCFYALFLSFFLARRSVPVLMAAWAGLIVGQAVFAVAPAASPLAVVLKPINLEFIAGLLAAVAVRRRSIPTAVAVLAGAAACGLQIAFASEAERVLFGVGAAFLIVAAVQAEQASRIRVPAVLLLLGEASYAIYLVHCPAISILARVSAPFGWTACFVACVVPSVLLGVAFHLWFEKRAVLIATRIATGRRPERADFRLLPAR